MNAPVAWPGETKSLRGVVFGKLTVEAPGRVDDAGVRVTCRCACGRIAVRLVSELGNHSACRVCRKAKVAKPTKPPRVLSMTPSAMCDRRRTARRRRLNPTVRTCPNCGSTWCLVPGRAGRPPTYCSKRCQLEHKLPKARVYRCSICGNRGHNALRCTWRAS